LRDAGVHLIGPGDITTDEELPNMGDVAARRDDCLPLLGGGRPAREQTLRGSLEEGVRRSSTPNFAAVAAWDAMAMIYTAIREQKGKLDPERTLDIFKHWKNPDSPRGRFRSTPRLATSCRTNICVKCAR